MAVPLNLLWVKHIYLPLLGFQPSKGHTYDLLMMAKLAGPPACVKDTSKRQRHRQTGKRQNH